MLVDNPGRIVSTGLNACIARAQGEVVARLDIHTQFAPDYLARCIDTLERSGADNVGGPWVAQGTGPMGEAIAAAFQCRWVVGGARSRDQGYEGAVDTVYLGCWRREAFARFGLFDEALVRNQDDEHNLRLRLGGGRIWQSGTIRSVYHPRGSLRHLYAQQQQYGYWRPFVVRKHGQPGSWRQLVPLLFVTTLALSVLLRTSVMICDNLSCMSRIEASNSPVSSLESTSIRADRSPSAICWATSTARLRGRVMLRVIHIAHATLSAIAAPATSNIACRICA